ncbi:MAG: type II secretion system F family protein [Proteobacteria bacterium]|nr:type II secretion system F family protein [Pseudomonadota bacterium]MDB4826182.1 type II secretion system F family protein [Gammaproteobacteria bacterium]
MASFQYSGVRDGKACSGTIEAPDRRQAITLLAGQSVQLQEIEEKADGGGGAGSGLSLRLGGAKKIKPRDITILTRQLATLLEAGFPLARALEFVSRQESTGPMSEMVADLSASIQQGQDFSQALSEYPKYFGNIFLSMVRAGETGGILDAMLVRLAEMREADEALADRFKSAMTYPAMMMGAMVIALGVMFAYVVPQFATMFEDMGRALPGPTQILLNVGDFAATWWPAVVAGVVVAGAGFKAWVKTESGAFQWDRTRLEIPVLGNFMAQFAIARLARTAGTLLESGVNLIDAFASAGDVSGNRYISHIMQRALADVRHGKPLAESLADAPVIPSLLREMIALGEESGQVGPMMKRVAEVYDRQTRETVSGITSIIEPFMVLFMGGVVGMVVIALLLPIFEMSTGGV